MGSTMSRVIYRKQELKGLISMVIGTKKIMEMHILYYQHN